jgi:hypothetical protein
MHRHPDLSFVRDAVDELRDLSTVPSIDPSQITRLIQTLPQPT